MRLPLTGLFVMMSVSCAIRQRLIQKRLDVLERGTGDNPVSSQSWVPDTLPPPLPPNSIFAPAVGSPVS
jgi:hypothetical protein